MEDTQKDFVKPETKNEFTVEMRWHKFLSGIYGTRVIVKLSKSDNILHISEKSDGGDYKEIEAVPIKEIKSIRLVNSGTLIVFRLPKRSYDLYFSPDSVIYSNMASRVSGYVVLAAEMAKSDIKELMAYLKDNGVKIENASLGRTVLIGVLASIVVIPLLFLLLMYVQRQ